MYHTGVYLQRGRGLGNLLSGLFRAVLPAAKTLGKGILNSQLTKDIAETAKKSAINAGLNLASDLVAGNNMKTSLENNVEAARENMSKTLQSYVQKKKKKRKRTNQNIHPPKKRFRKMKDIFD